MKNVWIRTLLTLPIALLVSCGAHSPSILKDHHRSIHVAVLKNETQQYALEERLTHALIAAFQRDGRLQIVPASRADLDLYGTIQNARVSPIGYTDLDRAIGYSMNVQMTVSVKERDSDEFLLKDRPFSAAGTFLLSNEPTSSSSRDVADILAEQVLSALIEGW